MFDAPEPALAVVSDALGLKTTDARRLLKKLAKAGWVVVPREPTNAMLFAYISAYGRPPTKASTVIHGIGKARKRWKAMAGAGMRLAMSLKRVKLDKDES